MSDYDRGPYTPPSEPPLAFDARRPVRGGGGPAPITLIISVIVLVAAAGGAFFVYRDGMRGPSDAPQPVGAPLRDVKTAPPPEAQPQDPAAGLTVYKDTNGAPASAPTFAPPPEAPTPRPAPQAANALPPPPAPPPAAAAQPAKPAAPAKPTTIAAILDNAPPVRPTPKAVPVARPAAPAGAGGAYVQIGAFSSQALADRGWNDAARIAPAAMAGKGKHVEQVAREGGVLYRTSITGFASKDEANALCDRLKAAGKTCFVR